MRKISRETDISLESVSRIAKQELQLKLYKLQWVHLLTADNLRVHLKISLRLLRRVARLNWERILFTDQKVFTIEQASPQSPERQELKRRGSRHVCYRRALPKSRVRDGFGLNLCHRQDPFGFRRWEGKIDQSVYRRNILDAVVVSCDLDHFCRQQWTLQQDSAPLSPQSESDIGVVQGPFSRLHHIYEMATVLTGSQPYGLQHLVNFGGQGPCYAPQKFGGSYAVVPTGVRPIVGGRVAAHILVFSETFEAEINQFQAIKYFIDKLFVIVTRRQQFFALLK